MTDRNDLLEECRNAALAVMLKDELCEEEVFQYLHDPDVREVHDGAAGRVAQAMMVGYGAGPNPGRSDLLATAKGVWEHAKYSGGCISEERIAEAKAALC